MNTNDLLFIAIVLLMILISLIILLLLKNKGEKTKMTAIQKSKLDMIDLEAITKNIEANYKPANIDLTSYEQEQENNAIISYDELVKNKDKSIVNYDDNYISDEDVEVRKVEFTKNIGTKISPTDIKVNLMSYEKEEAFLKALRKLQIDLAR